MVHESGKIFYFAVPKNIPPPPLQVYFVSLLIFDNESTIDLLHYDS